MIIEIKPTQYIDIYEHLSNTNLVHCSHLFMLEIYQELFVSLEKSCIALPAGSLT